MPSRGIIAEEAAERAEGQEEDLPEPEPLFPSLLLRESLLVLRCEFFCPSRLLLELLWESRLLPAFFCELESELFLESEEELLSEDLELSDEDEEEEDEEDLWLPPPDVLPEAFPEAFPEVEWEPCAFRSPLVLLLLEPLLLEPLVLVLVLVPFPAPPVTVTGVNLTFWLMPMGAVVVT